MMRVSLILALGLSAAPLAAQQNDDPLAGAEVVFLGEQHDNPGHHARQAEIVERLQPAAVVYEMLTAEQAAEVTPELISDAEAMAETLNWAESGWPDFEMYHPIFAAAPEAAVYGAQVPRDEARGLSDTGLARAFGEGAGFYGLDEDLPPEMQAAREELQMAAHCDALPAEVVPQMVDIQRLRDARLAETALLALTEHGTPVVVITGNGHARKDWGAPALIDMAAPEVSVASLGQAETGSGAPDGGFDMVEESEPVERDDPCAAFEQAPGTDDETAETPGN
ncbi:ChaN family lipoprotein [Salipiger mucosus]|uniref:Lipoprotein, putative n=1 Tax=Salipiger mucosus DSM 16094 TaxID=1123237 RepID=S9RRX7_9RHOB|nr:ChaN family lipoprotein [Salipiger mucosus]EPX76714.1 Lipoprotein, putative [Salipiger mucosus DSM 16094]